MVGASYPGLKPDWTSNPPQNSRFHPEGRGGVCLRGQREDGDTETLVESPFLPTPVARPGEIQQHGFHPPQTQVTSPTRLPLLIFSSPPDSLLLIFLLLLPSRCSSLPPPPASIRRGLDPCLRPLFSPGTTEDGASNGIGTLALDRGYWKALEGASKNGQRLLSH
ncbi:unnamed protein product [Pleuronectes platessa]|uniref:Uncharacterized protein n=1 Tax=Pleuronectes platessa TaxID=8262 RepID=A0A9N7U2U0_PLEPL|nr:unnamed protein product [Pleuronectes platessa]